ncbi:MAG: GNAT family N-acetyltransferase [bacterium]|nr:GNAT family N-acetyltransferase [bacterium]
MTFYYKTNELPGKEDFFDLFESTDWNNEYQLNAREIHDSLHSSWFMVSVYESSHLVGFGRIISDGKLHALITEVIVLPAHQGQGIGKEVMKRLLEKCKSADIRDIQLFSAKDKAGFYEKFGFSRRPQNAPGMGIKYRHDPA